MQSDATDILQLDQQAQGNGRQTSMGQYLLAREIEYIHQILGRTQRLGKLVDLCCGSEISILPLRSDRAWVVGLDLDWRALSFSRRLTPDTQLVCADALCLPISNNSFDGVIALHCFDQLDRARFLTQCWRILRHDGVLIFDALNRNSPKWMLRKLRSLISQKQTGQLSETWLNILSYDEIIQVVIESGYYVEADSGYSWLPFAQNSDNRWIDVMARIEKGFQLSEIPSLSPRILIAARKQAEH